MSVLIGLLLFSGEGAGGGGGESFYINEEVEIEEVFIIVSDVEVP